MNLVSIWRSAAVSHRYPSLTSDATVDVAIIGGGITGLTLALRLKEAGRSVAVLEMKSVGMGATGHSTGHLSSALDVDYATLQAKFGRDGASEAAMKGRQAIEHIQALVQEHVLDCEFRRTDGWRYTEASHSEQLEDEFEVAKELGLSVDLLDHGPLPFMRQSLRFGGQAMFHPVQYVQALAKLVDGDGCRVYEDTRVDKIVVGKPCELHVGPRVVRAAQIVHATHTPIGLVLPLQLRVAPYMSYVIGVRIDGEVPHDLYWDTAQPYHYLRPVYTASGPVLLIGGEDHKTGQEPNPAAHFSALEGYARHRFAVNEVAWRWSGEVFEPVDGLPYIGRLGSEQNVFAATGFAGAGLTMGTVAALDISRLILGGGRSTSALRPQRYKPVASAPKFIRENANVAWHLIADRISGAGVPRVDEVPRGEGRIAVVEGSQTAVYRAPNGQLHYLSPVCPHVGGIVQWNAAAASWDCPLHGSRFSPTGEVLAGPACNGLRVVEPPKPTETTETTDPDLSL